MNRREFIACGGAALAVGMAEAAEPRVPAAYRGNWSLAPNNRLNLACPLLAGQVRFFVVGDSHLAMKDARDDAFADNYRRMAQWPGDSASFEQMLAQAKRNGVDLVLLVGDIMSFPSLANVEFVSQALEKAGVPWLYVAGNHDWHFEGDSGSDAEQRDRWIARRLTPFYAKGANPLCHSRVVKGVRFVMIDDSDYLITPEQLAFWKAELAKGDPTVLAMHVPVWTPGWDSRFCLGAPGWGAANDPYWQIERRQRWPEKATPETFEFVKSVFAAPNLVSVFTGHIHSLMAAQADGLPMFSTPQSRKGEHLDVCLGGRS